MPTVLDAFALVALALGEPASDRVAAALQRGDAQISVLNLAEAADRLARGGGNPIDAVERALSDVVGELVEPMPLDTKTAWHAAELRTRHYHRRDSPLSLADCVALALTLASPGALLATADRPLIRAAQAEGAKALSLPDSTGAEF